MESIRLNLRTIKLHFKLSPAFIPLTILQAVFTALSPYLVLYFSGAIVDEMTGDGRTGHLIFLAVMIVGSQFTIAVLVSLMNKLNKDAREKFYVNYDHLVFNKTLSLDYEMLEDPEFSRQREKLHLDGLSVGGIKSFIFSFTRFITSIISGIISLFFLFRLFTAISLNRPDFTMVIVYIVMICIIAIDVWLQLYKSKKEVSLSKKAADGWSRVMLISRAYDVITLGKDSRIYGLWKFFSRSLDDQRDLKVGHEKESASLDLHIKGIGNLLHHMLTLLLYICIYTYAVNGIIGIGSVVTYVGTIHLSIAALTSILIEGGKIHVNSTFLKMYFEYLDLPVRTHLNGKKIIEPDNCDHIIEFVNVSFKYPGSDNYALRNLSAKINSKSKLAIVGENGCGKTTLIKLMCGLYEPTEGVITFDGTDIREYNYDEYFSAFSVVFQDFNLFAFTLGENIACSSVYDDEKVLRCIEKAGFSERFSEMPYGVNTHLYKDFEQEGVIISGGEAQKIALARALYKDAPYIILDEPTSALDPLAEYEIYSRFNEIVGERTAIYISHRLSSCRFCDDIIVLDKGELIQRGNHDTLVDDISGKYHALWSAQATYYQGGKI